jgi:cell division protein FtsA
MFALGGRTFTRRLAQFLGVPFDTAEEVKLSYSKNLLDDKSTKKVQKSLSSDCQVWISGVELILEEFAQELLPAKFLLCGGGSSLPDIKEALKDQTWRKKLPFAKDPILEFIQIPDVANIIDETNQLSDPQDITPASLANVALDYMGQRGVVEGVLNKIVQGMRE